MATKAAAKKVAAKLQASAAGEVEREATLQWVPIAETAVTDEGQRSQNKNWVAYLVANMELEQLGYPIVNHRDDHFYVIDGQHRIEALKQLGFEDTKIECFVYAGLSKQDEARRFLTWNKKLTVSAFDTFRIGVNAGLKSETAIAEIVDNEGLRIVRENVPGAIRATGTLKRIYQRAGGDVLRRSLVIIRDSFGDTGYTSLVLDGVALVVARYGNLDDATVIRKLSRVGGGALNLVGRAEVL